MSTPGLSDAGAAPTQPFGPSDWLVTVVFGGGRGRGESVAPYAPIQLPSAPKRGMRDRVIIRWADGRWSRA